MNADSLPAASHPAPHRYHIGFAALAFGLAAAPVAWSIQSVTGYALASYSCYPAATPRATPLLAHAGLLMMSLNIAALLVSAGGMAIAWHGWNATRRERSGSVATLMEVGEGRTRFLAMCGILISGGFVLATLFTSVALALSPLCR